jgi:two-component system, cell cycle sensor histidine kinase and response regulator CckA
MTVLVVEDDDRVRQFSSIVLRNSGYTVLTAASGDEALAIAGQRTERIDAVLTDVLMPGLSGPQVVERLLAIYPNLRVICSSGFVESSALLEQLRDPRWKFLPKPYTPKQLREVIAAACAPDASSSER